MLPSPSSQDNAGASKMHLDSMSLISFDPSVIVNDPQWSPPSTANTQVESRIFQFPPQQPLIKQEDPTWTTLQEPGAGFSSIVPVSSSSPQCSPMAISPSMSTLNTPRGSITSMRSQQSPMDQQHPGPGLPDPIMSNYEPFDAAPAFVSYTTVSHQQSLVSLCLDKKMERRKNHFRKSKLVFFFLVAKHTVPSKISRGDLNDFWFRSPLNSTLRRLLYFFIEFRRNGWSRSDGRYLRFR